MTFSAFSPYIRRSPPVHDVRDLVGVGRVVGHDGRVRRGEERGVAVGVLGALAGQRRPARGRADEEAPGQLVGGRPDRVPGPLEPEHRVEDVDRDHRLAVGGVGRARRGEGGRRPGLVDAEVEDLALGRLAVAEHELGVDRRVVLPVRVVDLQGREEAVHPEGPRLVGDDRHDPPAELLVAHEVLEQPDEGHRRRDLLLAGPLARPGRTRRRPGSEIWVYVLRRCGSDPPRALRRSSMYSMAGSSKPGW